MTKSENKRKEDLLTSFKRPKWPYKTNKRLQLKMQQTKNKHNQVKKKIEIERTILIHNIYSCQILIQIKVLSRG